VISVIFLVRIDYKCHLFNILGYIEGDEFITASNIEQFKDNLDELYTHYNDQIQGHDFRIVPSKIFFTKHKIF